MLRCDKQLRDLLPAAKTSRALAVCVCGGGGPQEAPQLSCPSRPEIRAALKELFDPSLPGSGLKSPLNAAGMTFHFVHSCCRCKAKGPA